APSFFFFYVTSPSHFYTLSLHDALPISLRCRYSSEDLPASTRSIVVLPDSDATNLAVSDRLCLFVGGTVHAPSPYCRCVEFRNSNNRLLSNPSSRCHPCRKADRWEERKAA